MMKRVKLITGLIILVALSVQAQTGKTDGSKYGKGEDSVRCVTNLSLYREYARNHDYKMAIGYWKVVFEECPKSTKNIYIDGARMYRELLDQDVTPERKNDLSDTLMLIYDRRIQNFGEKGKVRGFQGADLLKYRRNDGIEYIQQGYDYLKESLELKEEEAPKAVLPTLLSASLTLYKEGKIPAKQCIEDYIMVSSTMDIMIKEDPNDKRLTDLKAILDNNFVDQGPSDCSILIDYFTKESKTKGNDSAFLTMLTDLLSARNCTESDLYFTSLKNLFKLAPSSESAVKIALYAKDRGKNTESVTYFQKAIDMESNADKKADYYLGMAVAYQKLNDKPKAREAALNAAQARSGYGEPYILIGQLYADSKDECASEKLPNAIFWAAVDMFNKAKSVDPSVGERVDKLIATYSPYFPDREKAFFENITEGQSYTVGCWINETTRVRFNK